MPSVSLMCRGLGRNLGRGLGRSLGRAGRNPPLWSRGFRQITKSFCLGGASAGGLGGTAFGAEDPQQPRQEPRLFLDVVICVFFET